MGPRLVGAAAPKARRPPLHCAMEPQAGSDALDASQPAHVGDARQELFAGANLAPHNAYHA
eukprot:6658796-Pyramimonas_sp.AAC.1